jgi:hypothetical protein
VDGADNSASGGSDSVFVRVSGAAQSNFQSN